MLLGVVQDVELDLPLEVIELGDQLEVGFDADPDVRIDELFGDGLPVGLVGDPGAERLHVVLAVGVLDVTDEVGALTGQEVASSQKIPGGAHGGGIDVGHGEVTAAQESGDLAGIDAVVLGLPAVDGLHV